MTGTLTAGLRRVRDAHGEVSFTSDPAPAASDAARPLRAARMLAVAHALARMLAEDGAPSRRELAKALGMSGARLSQLLDLALLAPDIQEELLFMQVPLGQDAIPERALRHVVRALDWNEQRRRFARLREGGGRGTRCQPAGAPAPRRRRAQRTPSRGREGSSPQHSCGGD